MLQGLRRKRKEMSNLIWIIKIVKWGITGTYTPPRNRPKDFRKNILGDIHGPIFVFSLSLFLGIFAIFDVFGVFGHYQWRFMHLRVLVRYKATWRILEGFGMLSVFFWRGLGWVQRGSGRSALPMGHLFGPKEWIPHTAPDLKTPQTPVKSFRDPPLCLLIPKCMKTP